MITNKANKGTVSGSYNDIEACIQNALAFIAPNQKPNIYRGIGRRFLHQDFDRVTKVERIDELVGEQNAVLLMAKNWLLFVVWLNEKRSSWNSFINYSISSFKAMKELAVAIS
jgi:hypothetical protein